MNIILALIATVIGWYLILKPLLRFLSDNSLPPSEEHRRNKGGIIPQDPGEDLDAIIDRVREEYIEEKRKPTEADRLEAYWEACRLNKYEWAAAEYLPTSPKARAVVAFAEHYGFEWQVERFEVLSHTCVYLSEAPGKPISAGSRVLVDFNAALDYGRFEQDGDSLYINQKENVEVLIKALHVYFRKELGLP
jgi:hypothetical protein